jgi:glycosyltransferase involved in cell wall biosynthesis
VLSIPAPSDGALKALYLHATAVVVPSLYEGFGLPALEAMRLGCPVVASHAAALPEVCADAALYVDPLSPADIARGMQRVADDPALRQRLVDAGHARAAHFTWAASARALHGALAGVMA